jgi:hypothetical protein
LNCPLDLHLKVELHGGAATHRARCGIALEVVEWA